jgi:hypothetical protein
MKNFSFASLLILFALTDSTGQSPPELLLKNYRPQSIYKIPVNKPEKALYAAIDMHSHPYAKNKEDVESWIRVMNQANIKKTIILVTRSGAAFDSISKLYAPFGESFDLWCGLDIKNIESADWGARAVKELERCKNLGAKGVGELLDEGEGFER